LWSAAAARKAANLTKRAAHRARRSAASRFGIASDTEAKCRAHNHRAQSAFVKRTRKVVVLANQLARWQPRDWRHRQKTTIAGSRPCTTRRGLCGGRRGVRMGAYTSRGRPDEILQRQGERGRVSVGVRWTGWLHRMSKRWVVSRRRLDTAGENKGMNDPSRRERHAARLHTGRLNQRSKVSSSARSRQPRQRLKETRRCSPGLDWNGEEQRREARRTDSSQPRLVASRSRAGRQTHRDTPRKDNIAERIAQRFGRRRSVGLQVPCARCKRRRQRSTRTPHTAADQLLGLTGTARSSPKL